MAARSIPSGATVSAEHRTRIREPGFGAAPRSPGISRDKAVVCGQKASGYKGLPHHSGKPHVPRFKLFIAENV
jgi:hypothetical protein